MNHDELRGLVIGKVSETWVIDREKFMEKVQTQLEGIELESTVSEVVDELIEEGWIDYIEEGNNFKINLPEGEKEE